MEVKLPLKRRMGQVGSIQLLDQQLSYHLFLSLHEYYLSNWLGQQEEIHRIVVYQSDSWMSEWTKRCIRQVRAVPLTFLYNLYYIMSHVVSFICSSPELN